MSEAAVVKRVMMKASQLGHRLFRNNRGQFYTMDKKRIVRAGLEAGGASDLIGPTSITITQDMVGITFGVMTCAEVKDTDWKRPSGEHELEQQNFIDQMEARGCFAFFINNPEDFEKKISESLKKKIDMAKAAV